MADLKATHVSRVTSILQTVLIAFHEKLEEKSAQTPYRLTTQYKNVSCTK